MQRDELPTSEQAGAASRRDGYAPRMLFSTDPTLVERAIDFLQDEDWSTAVTTLGGIMGLLSLVVGVPITWRKAYLARRSAAEAEQDRQKAVEARDAALKAAEAAAEAQKRIAAAMERLRPKDWQLTRVGHEEFELENVSGQPAYKVAITWLRQRSGPLVIDAISKGASLPVHIPYGANYHPTQVEIAWSDSPDGEATSSTTLAVRWQE